MAINLWETGLIASLVLAGVALVLAAVSLVRQRKLTQANEKLYQRLLRDISVANTGSVGMGQRLLEMEKRLQQNSQKNSPNGYAKNDFAKDEDFQPYSEAAQLFKMGLSSEEVANRCGLSRAEASLMEMMQKASR